MRSISRRNLEVIMKTERITYTSPLDALVAVSKQLSIYFERYQEEILTDSLINLCLRLRFENGYLLAVKS